MKFLDEAKIYLKSGSGGAGCLSFRREKNIEFGGPNGGNGGGGGNIIFEIVETLNTLIDFRYKQHFKAQNGQNGMGDNRSGASGADCIIKVPAGTQILDEDNKDILADFTEDGDSVIFIKGGDGGFGNAHYKSSTNQAPRKTTPGWSGQEMAVWLRLKLIADAGLIGLPNAGKSTFLASCSNAKPKIADYPFTTLHPNLGVFKIGEYDFVLADIPGLIKGAHEGIGLGHRFLGHVERTNVLLHLVDCTHDNIIEAYTIIRNELKEYGCNLENKEEIIAINKIDALGEELAEDQRLTLEEAIGKPVYKISAVSGEGIKNILFKLAETINRVKYQKEDQEEEIYIP